MEYHNFYQGAQTGDILHLEERVPHSLLAKEDSTIRLTLSQHDSVERVSKVETA